MSNVAVTEGTDAFAVFTVGLSNLSTTNVIVGLALADGTAIGGGVDYGTAARAICKCPPMAARPGRTR